MYKMLIVDDEAEIREGLCEAVDFQSLGFTVVGQAENGVEGLRLAESSQPDLVISDIRMPLMDGLTMAEKMRRFLPTVRFIILSGYEEFEYARQAIDISVMSYLLKPMSKREITEVLLDVKRRMDEEFERQTDLVRLRAHFEASLSVMRETLLGALASGDMGAEEAGEAAIRYGIPLASPAYVIALIRVSPEEAEIQDPELSKLAVKNIAEEVLSRKLPGYTFHHNGMLAVLLLLPGMERESLCMALEVLEEVQKSAERFTGCPLVIGVSTQVSSVSLMRNCAAQAETALHHARAFGAGKVLCFSDIAPSNPKAVVVEDYALKALSDAIKMGEVERARLLVANLLALPRSTSMTIRDYRAYLLEILMTFMRIGRDLDIARPPQGDRDIYEQLMLCPPVNTAARLMDQLCAHFARSVAEKHQSSSRHLAAKAAAYLDGHFSLEDLSIEKAAAHLHISTSYLSAIFRKEIQKTFVQYLTELRMDAAMNLLVSTDMKTAQIAQQVGIPDPSYFSYSFRKYFGVAPTQARKGTGESYG